jgi:formate--tetrahydrofolate ligase
MTDIEIAQKTPLKPIAEVAADTLGLPETALELYGRYKAKMDAAYLNTLPDRPESKLILVTAMSPTPAGEGKTATCIGLGDALNYIGKKALICLREPSLGPVFGMKGGAAGGGYAQVVPMEDINLHFTGDFHAIAAAHNLLSALLDNHIHQGNALSIDVRRIRWKRVMDMNDRALRNIVVGLGGPNNGLPREDGFDIVVASEVMAIFCLATSLQDLKTRLGEIIVAYNTEKQPVRARDLQAHGAMAALLKNAIQPNLVQTLEHNPAFIHGGPFANIAHGCNSVLATKNALKLADYVVTEAGFGADLGAEKFFDIKCRKSGLRPAAAVVVATIRALKYHGGVEVTELQKEDTGALERGYVNLERHLQNLRQHFGMSVVVAINHFTYDTPAELQWLLDRLQQDGVTGVVARHWAEGGRGAAELAKAVVQTIETTPSEFRFLYADELPLWEKMRTIATRIYGASDIKAESGVKTRVDQLEAEGYGHLPVCVAKTQYSFSTDVKKRGAPGAHTIAIREVRLSAGAGFVVMISGDIMTMPGLPKVPSAEKIDIDDKGRITGLF